MTAARLRLFHPADTPQILLAFSPLDRVGFACPLGTLAAFSG